MPPWIRSATLLTDERQQLIESASAGRGRRPVSHSLSKMELAALVKIGMAHRDNHRFEEARDTFSRIRALCPTEPNAEIGLGSVCFSEGRFEAAIGHYRQALKLNPSNAYAYALLGESQFFHGERCAARVSLRRAHKLDPKGPYGRLAEHLLVFMESLPANESRSPDKYENQS